MKGDVIMAKMGFFKKLKNSDGFVNVFPNHKHANRTDGIGMSTLSPMTLGPVEHGQEGLPNAVNLENFWQQSKWFPCETEDQFNNNRATGYLMIKPKRHKFKRGMKPTGWVWEPKNGERHVLHWVQSRQFYCNFYERLVKENAEFIELKKMVDDGQNIQICGYDALPDLIKACDIEKWYLQGVHPFGHEAVLFTMLVEPDENKWPWRKHKTFDF